MLKTSIPLAPLSSRGRLPPLAAKKNSRHSREMAAVTNYL